GRRDTCRDRKGLLRRQETERECQRDPADPGEAEAQHGERHLHQEHQHQQHNEPRCSSGYTYRDRLIQHTTMATRTEKDQQIDMLIEEIKASNVLYLADTSELNAE